MTLKKLPSRFSKECLSGKPEDILGLFDVAWAGYQKITLKDGQALSISNTESLQDFVRTSFIVILSGHAQFDGCPSSQKPGDAFLLEHWHITQIKAGTDTELLLARTCGTPSSFRQVVTEKTSFFRREMAQVHRLPSPADLAEMLLALKTGLLGAAQIQFSALCDDILSQWRLRYHEQVRPDRKLEQLIGLINEFIKQSRHVLVGHELINGQRADEVTERWFNHWVDFVAVRKSLTLSNLPKNLGERLTLFEQPVFYRGGSPFWQYHVV